MAIPQGPENKPHAATTLKEDVAPLNGLQLDGINMSGATHAVPTPVNPKQNIGNEPKHSLATPDQLPDAVFDHADHQPEDPTLANKPNATNPVPLSTTAGVVPVNPNKLQPSARGPYINLAPAAVAGKGPPIPPPAMVFKNALPPSLQNHKPDQPANKAAAQVPHKLNQVKILPASTADGPGHTIETETVNPDGTTRVTIEKRNPAVANGPKPRHGYHPIMKAEASQSVPKPDAKPGPQASGAGHTPIGHRQGRSAFLTPTPFS